MDRRPRRDMSPPFQSAPWGVAGSAVNARHYASAGAGDAGSCPRAGQASPVVVRLPRPPGARRPAGGGSRPRRGPGPRARSPWPASTPRPARPPGSPSSSTPSRRACRRRPGSPPRPPRGRSPRASRSRRPSGPAAGPPRRPRRSPAARARCPTAASSSSTPAVASSANQRARDCETVGPTPSISANRSGSSRATSRRNAPIRASQSAARLGRRPGASTQRARSIAVVSPTCGMPEAVEHARRAAGLRERWIEAYRFSALLRANRSSDSRSSTVSR